WSVCSDIGFVHPVRIQTEFPSEVLDCEGCLSPDDRIGILECCLQCRFRRYPGCLKVLPVWISRSDKAKTPERRSRKNGASAVEQRSGGYSPDTVIPVVEQFFQFSGGPLIANPPQGECRSAANINILAEERGFKE